MPMPCLSSIARTMLRSGGIACAAVVGTALAAVGAEKIQFFVGGTFEVTLYVEDLTTFAEEGRIPERLRGIASRFDEPQLESIRTLLNTPYDLDLVAISQFTYGSFGEQLLHQVGQLVQTDRWLNGEFALRSGLLLAAANEPDCCTVLEVMQHYPLDIIQLNLPLVMAVVNENNHIFRLRDEVVAGVREIALEQVEADGVATLPSYQPQLPGPYDWQRETITFQNPGRSLPSRADLYLPDPARAADPGATGESPVVVISHGIASDRHTFAYLAEHLASYGYAVVALEHSETSAEKFSRFLQGLEGPPEPADLLNRPRDITAVLDTLERRASTDRRLQALNLRAVGVLGQSLGGYTVLAAGGATINRTEAEAECLANLSERPSVNLSLLVQCRILEIPADMSLEVQDDRVRAVVAINPITSGLFGQSGLSQLQAPVLVIGATDDFFAPIVPEQIMPFTWFTQDESYLVIMERGTHFSFLGSPRDGAFPLPESLIGPTPELARPQLKGLSVAFFNRYLLGRREDEAFLTQAYLGTMAQDPFRFDIIHNFFE